MKNKNELPIMTLRDCITQLDLNSIQIMNLKLAVFNLLSAIEAGNMNQCKIIIDVYKVKETLDSLNLEKQ